MSFFQLKKNIIAVSMLSLLVFFSSCTTIRFDFNNYNNKKIALLYAKSFYVLELTPSEFIIFSEDRKAKDQGIEFVGGKQEMEIYNHFKAKSYILFKQAQIPNFKFNKNDIYCYKEFQTNENKFDYQSLKSKGYTNVLLYDMQYNLEGKKIHIGCTSRLYDIDEFLTKTFPDYVTVMSVDSNRMINSSSRYSCLSINYLKENSDDEYYSHKEIMLGENSLFFQVHKASINFYLENMIKVMETKTYISQLGVLNKTYSYHEFIASYGKL